MRYTGVGHCKKRGLVPRFVVVGDVAISHSRASAAPLAAPPEGTLADAFERAALALPYDAAFAGLELVTVKARRQGRSLELSAIVDREGGVDLETCGRIATYLNRALDAYADPYTLAVESAGLDRPLVRPADYDRFRDRAVKIVTTLAIDGRKTHRGTLLGVRGPAAIVVVDGVELPIPLELIKTANVDFDIRADLTRAKREKHARKER